MYKRNAKGKITGKDDQFEEKYKDPMDAVRQINAFRPASSPARFW